MKKLITNLSVLFCSCIVSVFIVEGMARVFLDEGNYVIPITFHDVQFGRRIIPESAGHDKWGFRNKEVPESSDTITIGDSFTYGFSASSDNAWPQVVAKKLDRKIYNLAMGGWGANQYLCALESFGIALKPKKVIFGFYIGNDLTDAHIYTHNNQQCVNKNPEKINKDFVSDYKNHMDWQSKPEFDTFAKAMMNSRTWLSQNSVLYQMVKYEFGGIVQNINLAISENVLPDNYAVYKGKNDRKFVAWSKMAENMSLSKDVTKNGMKATEKAIDDIAAFCKEKNITPVFVFIPPREAVYAALADENDERQAFLKATEKNTKIISDRLLEKAKEHSIKTIDTIDVLQKAVLSADLFPMGADAHFNSAGYRVIGEKVAEELKDK